MTKTSILCLILININKCFYIKIKYVIMIQLIIRGTNEILNLQIARHESRGGGGDGEGKNILTLFVLQFIY